MSMNSLTLGTAIKNRIKTITLPPGDPNYDAAVWQAVADEIILHLKNNMEIKGTPNTGIIVSGTATVTDQGKNLDISGGDGNIS